MTTLDTIKGATKFIGAQFLFGEEVSKRQAARLHVCNTSGANGGACHNFVLVKSLLGKTPRCCKAGESGCAPHHNGCACFLMEKTKYEGEYCPLKKW
jgi:hypothetical protein